MIKSTREANVVTNERVNELTNSAEGLSELLFCVSICKGKRGSMVLRPVSNHPSFCL